MKWKSDSSQLKRWKTGVDSRGKMIPKFMATAMGTGLEKIIATSQKKYLTGGTPLNVQSGVLRSSLTYLVQIAGKIIRGIVGTDIWYGRVHELGLTVTTKNAVIKYPQRQFLAPAVKDEMKGVERLFERAGASFGKTKP